MECNEATPQNLNLAFDRTPEALARVEQYNKRLVTTNEPPDPESNWIEQATSDVI